MLIFDRAFPFQTKFIKHRYKRFVLPLIFVKAPVAYIKSFPFKMCAILD